MMDSWSFQRRITAGFAAMAALAVVVGLLSIYGLRSVVASYEALVEDHVENEVAALRMKARSERRSSAARGFLLSGETRFRTRYTEAGQLYEEAAAELDVSDADSRAAVERVEDLKARLDSANERVFEMVRTGTEAPVVSQAFEREVAPLEIELTDALNTLVDLEAGHLEEERAAATTAASRAGALVAGLDVIAVLLAVMVGWALIASLARQIGAATQHIQSSSTELQTAATQQATSAKEQATAMHEIATTIRELLSTSRQIAESAKQVASIASETEEAARSGERAVGESQTSAEEIRRQTDQIVEHMLDLGRKSQRIGGILDLVNELTEQTNIVAINATIEAAGAGESGRRFAVVADEIRRLADRLAASTKEIRTLIEEIRAAVNTSVMATETGAKAVDANVRKFVDVTKAFGRIVELVGTTTEAAREIELSTKQQSTAVEQVNLAVANVAQAARETEASSVQTSQTASQLTNLSRDLGRITGAVA